VSDYLFVSKALLGSYTECKLLTLATRYIPTFDHTPHDARSDAVALFKIMMRMTPLWKVYLWASGTPLTAYISRIGFTVKKIVATNA
jgi:hypothetical protein